MSSVGPDTDAAAPSASAPITAPSKKDITPSVLWYWVGALLLVVGVGGAFALMIAAIVTVADAPNSYERISVPGERTLTFTETGEYTLYGETLDDYYSYSYTSTIIPPVVKVTDSSGNAVAVFANEYLSSSRDYSTGQYSAFDFASFRISAPGTYTVAVSSPAPTKTEEPTTPTTGEPRSTTTTTRYSTRSVTRTFEVSRVAVGQPGTSRAGTLFLSSVLLGFIGTIAGIVLLIVIAVKRSGSRRRLFPPARYAPYQPTPYGMAPGYGPRPGYGPGPYGPGPGYGPAPGYGPGPYGPAPGYGPTPGRPAPPPPFGGGPGGYAPPGAGGPPPGAYPPGAYGGPASPPGPSGAGSYPPGSGAPSGPPRGAPLPTPPGAVPVPGPGAGAGGPADWTPPQADVPDFVEPPSGSGLHPPADPGSEHQGGHRPPEPPA